MSKLSSTSFKKGTSGNPSGKPKGAYSAYRKKLFEMKQMAADNAVEAYNTIWQDFKNGDPLAKQIYFKELVSVPQSWLDGIEVREISKLLDGTNDLSTIQLELLKSILAEGAISREEAIELLKIFNRMDELTKATNSSSILDQKMLYELMLENEKLKKQLEAGLENLKTSENVT